VKIKLTPKCVDEVVRGEGGVEVPYNFKMQPVVLAEDGCVRFAENRIVRKLLTVAQETGFGLNEIALAQAKGMFSQEEVEQLTQLIGYSVSGFCDLSTSRTASKRRASKSAALLT